MSDLKPCPFCGGEASSFEDYGHSSAWKVGKHRRVRMEDVMSYKAAIDTEREAVLDQLAADAQEQDMGYRSK